MHFRFFPVRVKINKVYPPGFFPWTTLGLGSPEFFISFFAVFLLALTLAVPLHFLSCFGVCCLCALFMITSGPLGLLVAQNPNGYGCGV